MNNILVQKLTQNQVHDVAKIESELIGKVDEEKIKDTISNDKLSYYVMMMGEDVIGFFECLLIAPEAELYDIAIKKDCQGKGYSKILMNYFINLCVENGCETIFLEVNSINSVAQNLYASFGFESYSVRKNYYGENDAILMKKKLN